MPFVANFADAKARKGAGGGQQLVTGYYKAKTISKDPNSKPTSVLIQLELIEPGFEGIQRRVYLGTDASKAGNKNSWYTAALSHQLYTPEDMQTGEEIAIDEADFVDRECVIYVKAKDPNDANSKDDVQFVTPEAYEEGKAAQESSAAAETETETVEEAPAAPAKPAAKPAPAKPAVAAKPAPAKPAAAAPPTPPVKPAGGAGLKALLANKKAPAATA